VFLMRDILKKRRPVTEEILMLQLQCICAVSLYKSDTNTGVEGLQEGLVLVHSFFS